MRKITFIALSLALLLGLAAGLVRADSSAISAINWQVLAGGGHPATTNQGNISLNGTLGQPVIGPASGGDLTLSAGYWHSARSEHKIYLPLLLRNVVTAPDLTVDSLIASSSEISLIIRNAGNAPVIDAFWVDVYFDPTLAPPQLNQTWQSIAPYGAAWGVTAPLAPGEALTLTLGGPYYYEGSSAFPAGAQVYAYVDSVNYATTYGNVWESDEANNVWGPVVSTAGQAQPAVTGSTALPDQHRLPAR